MFLLKKIRSLLLFKKQRCFDSGYEISLRYKVLWFCFRLENYNGIYESFYSCTVVCPWVFFTVYVCALVHIKT